MFGRVTRSGSIRTTTAALCLLFVALVTGGAPPGASAQPKPPRVGIILFGTPESDPNLPALLAGLRDLGYVDGRNVAIDVRYAAGRPERLDELAAETVAARPHVIVVLGGDIVPAARRATSTIPIVMLTSQDPVEAGEVASFARPGGNVTGVAFVSPETSAKRLQFLKEAAPSIAKLALLWSSAHPDGEYRNTVAAARQLGLEVVSLDVRGPDDFDGAFQTAVRERVEALIVASSRLMLLNRGAIAQFAARQRIPLVASWGPWAHTGGLMSYGPDLNALLRRAATHVDKILKGARPGDLPVEQPTKFELIVNTRTARTLGLSLSRSLLLRADQVIE